MIKYVTNCLYSDSNIYFYSIQKTILCMSELEIHFPFWISLKCGDFKIITFVLFLLL